jgi:hypothetical protein
MTTTQTKGTFTEFVGFLPTLNNLNFRNGKFHFETLIDEDKAWSILVDSMDLAYDFVDKGTMYRTSEGETNWQFISHDDHGNKTNGLVKVVVQDDKPVAVVYDWDQIIEIRIDGTVKYTLDPWWFDNRHRLHNPTSPRR